MKKIILLLAILFIFPVQKIEAAGKKATDIQQYSVKPGTSYKTISADGCYYNEYSDIDGELVPEMSETLCSADEIQKLALLYQGEGWRFEYKEPLERDTGGSSSGGSRSGGRPASPLAGTDSDSGAGLRAVGPENNSDEGSSDDSFALE